MVKTKSTETSRTREDFHRNVETVRDSASDIVKGVNRVLKAWTDASTEMWVGSFRVFSGWVSDTEKTLHNLVETEKDEDEQKDKGSASRVRAFSQAICDSNDNMCRALSESANVFKQSSQRFLDSYDETETGEHARKEEPV